MIEIRPEQMEMFAERDRTAFIQRAAAYLRQTQRAALPGLEEPALQELIRRQCVVARAWGLQSETAVMQFIEIGLAFGEDFHRARKYPLAEEILSSSRDEISKIRDLVAASGDGFGVHP